MSTPAYNDTLYRYKIIKQIRQEAGEFPMWMELLPTQIMRIFLNDKIFSLESALDLSDNELLRMPNFGIRSLYIWRTQIVPKLTGEAK